MKIKEKQIQNRCQEAFFFKQRIINVWNGLLGKIVKAKTRRSLKKQLEDIMVQKEKGMRHDEPNVLYSLQECLMFSRNLDTGRSFQGSRVGTSYKSRQIPLFFPLSLALPLSLSLPLAFCRCHNTTSRNSIKAVLRMGVPVKPLKHFLCKVILITIK